MKANEHIAATLREAGLDARSIDGWVYVALPDGRLLWIGAELGASLDAEVYESQPAWFKEAATEPEAPEPYVHDPTVPSFQNLFWDLRCAWPHKR